jgi:pimeloyl-ACP methyl ester carboxylesterase
MKNFITVAALSLAVFTFASCHGTRQVQRTPGTRYAPFETGMVFYDDIGPDQPTALVLVHGWSCDMTMWQENMGELSVSMRTIALDLPGHGESGGPADGYTMEFFARAVDAVVRNAGVEHAILVGHSNGTPIIREYYRMYPEKVAAMIVVEGALQQTATPAMLEGFITEMQGKGSREAITEHIDGMLLEDMDPEMKDHILSTILRTPRGVMIDSLRGTADPDIWRDDPIEVPLMLILSEADPAWSRSYEYYVRRLAPQVDYRKLRGVGHFLMMDNPGLFNETVISFLQDEGLF